MSQLHSRVNRQRHLVHQIVDFVPEELKDGILYVSFKYGTALHKCCCGCGEEVVTPLGPADWSIEIGKKGASLYPSIGNWSYACQSHYWIRGGRVVWAGAMSRDEIERGRKREEWARDHYIKQKNRSNDVAKRPLNGISRSLSRLMRWLLS